MSEEPAAEPQETMMARGEEHRGKRILANSAVMTGGQIVIVLIGLVLTPITISAVGIALFGAWGIITSVSSYINILDPGTSGIVSRFGAMAHVRGDHHEMARLTSLGMLSWVALGSLGVPIMIVAVIAAVLVMMFAADPLSNFIKHNPTIVMLALGFLIMIGMTLIAEGFGAHVPKGYVYTAMAFSAGVEGLNILSRRSAKNRKV